MATSGPNYAGTATSGSPLGDVTWSSPSNATGSSIITAAQSALDIDQFTYTLLLSNYSFSIPTDATVNTITVVVSRRGSGAGDARDYIIKLKDSTGLIGTNKADGVTNWTSATSPPITNTYVFTNGVDTIPSISEINATTFGVGVQAYEIGSDPETVFVYFVSITIDYTESGGAGLTSRTRSMLMSFQ